mgnify:CR=1 FL=1
MGGGARRVRRGRGRVHRGRRRRGHHRGGTNAEPDTFTYSVNSEVMIGWDPATGYSNEVIALHNIYETLTRYNAATQEVDPLLAESWESSKDGLTWTFTLRPDVTFHTGNPLTADAAKASIERTMEIGEGAAYIWGAVKKIDAPDDTTLVFHLSYPSPLDLVSSGTYSAYIYDTTASGGQDLGDWFADGNDAGTGPYMVSEYNPGDEIELRLEAYPDYWGGWDDADHYERYVFPRDARGEHRGPAAASGRGLDGPADEPAAVGVVRGQDGFKTGERAVVADAARHAEHRRRPARRHAGPRRDHEGGRLQRDDRRPRGVRPTRSRAWCRQACGATPTVSSTSRTWTRRGRVLEQAGFGPSGDPLDLSLTYLKGDADEEARRDAS